MKERKIGTANTNECGLIKGKKYILENKSYGVWVYDIEGNYLCCSRIDNFDNIKNIE